jgi:iron(III) transport system substrate-binding protein
MLSRLIQLIARRPWLVLVALVVPVAIVVFLAVGDDSDDALVVYNGRSHYGDEQVFEDFEEATGIEVELRGGTAPELYERLRREGDDTSADLLITTDLANLWRAEDAGLLRPVSSPVLEEHVPPELSDADGAWWALSTRLRVPVVSTERVGASEVTSYEDLGDPRFEGRTCLRTSGNEYNQSLVADMIAKRGREATEELLRSWMANDPQILNSDGELLAVIAAGDCDVGLSNHYYLGRALAEDPDFPVAPAWPDQDGAGAHANVSGIGLVRWSDDDEDAIALMEFLTDVSAQEEIVTQSEFAANPDVPPPEHIRDWADVRIDPIAVDEAGPLVAEAVELMLEVGWR